MKYETEQTAQVQDIAPGEYVKRLFCNGTQAGNKVYKRGPYNPKAKRYALEDCDDISREIYVKKGTRLLVGFTY